MVRYTQDSKDRLYSCVEPPLKTQSGSFGARTPLSSVVRHLNLIIGSTPCKPRRFCSQAFFTPACSLKIASKRALEIMISAAPWTITDYADCR